jgi:hypothetical protein
VCISKIYNVADIFTCSIMSSSSRNKKSGTGSNSRPSTKPSSKSSSKSKSTPKTDNPEEWTDWQPDPNSLEPREYRAREFKGKFHARAHKIDKLSDELNLHLVSRGVGV